MGKLALKIWENQYKIIKKIPQKRLQEKLSLAILDYAFTGKHDKLEFPLDAIIQSMYIGLTLKNQGGAPIGNTNNRYTTVVQPLYECCTDVVNNVSTTEEQPLLEIRNKKEEIRNIKKNKQKEKISFSDVVDWKTLFTYWEENKKGGKYKNDESRARMLAKLQELTNHDFTIAKEAICHAIDNGYQGFCNGNQLFYKADKVPKSTSIFDEEPKKEHDWSWV